jgi:hypothetical protein
MHKGIKVQRQIVKLSESLCRAVGIVDGKSFSLLYPKVDAFKGVSEKWNLTNSDRYRERKVYIGGFSLIQIRRGVVYD